MAFTRIPESEWVIHPSVAWQRRRFLLRGLSFEEIVQRIVQSANCVRILKNVAKANPAAKRAVVTLQMPPSLVDAFHNSAAGYRAQFYKSPTLGESANRYAIDALQQRILAAAKPSGRGWLRASLGTVDAKLWIHQGLWLRWERRADRNLLVSRWLASQNCLSRKGYPLANWAILTPAAEQVIEVKGGFVEPSGGCLPPQKGRRASQLHRCGFT
jgi:hypothetical protein